MTTQDALLSCPFCHTPVAARDDVCKGCRARKRVRTGMSPRSFRWYVASWALLSVPLVVLALVAALLPWLPHGETPGYALALVGAKPLDPVPRCRVEVLEASGRRSEVLSAEACRTGPASEPVRRGPPTGPDLTTVRMAAALHSLLTLSAALLASWALLRLLRRPFLQRSAPSWVRRAAA